MMAMDGPKTPTFEMIVVSERHKRAYQAGHSFLSALLGLALPAGWPQFPQAFAPRGDAGWAPNPWPGYFIVDVHCASVVGNCGYHGPPCEGEVQIGYEIAPEFRNRGYATAAARKLIALAFDDPAVVAVVAQTLPGNAASSATLRKAGMRHVGTRHDACFGELLRWRIDRASQAPQA
jgi:RimJ/RimL family protein N-acetyltransferase